MIRILLVEDDSDLLEQLVDTLDDAFPKHSLHPVSTVKEAINVIKKHLSVSLIVTDYQLPDGTGYDLLKYCQEHLTNVPVIIITAYANTPEKDVSAALSFQKGAFDFIPKRIDPEELTERIKHALEISEALA